MEAEKAWDKAIMLGIKNSLITGIKEKLEHLNSMYYTDDNSKYQEHAMVEQILSSVQFLEQEIINNG